MTENAVKFFDRSLLISTVVKMGLHWNILTKLQFLLRCKLQHVLDEETLSEKRKQEIYHLRFLIFFIADLYALKRDELELAFYVDDQVLGRSSTAKSFLQQSLNNLELCCSRNHLNVNVAQTKAKKFRGGRSSKYDKVFLSCETIICTNKICKSATTDGLNINTDDLSKKYVAKHFGKIEGIF